MTTKEINQNHVRWLSSLRPILGPLDAKDHALANKVREVCVSIDATRERIEREGIKR